MLEFRFFPSRIMDIPKMKKKTGNTNICVEKRDMKYAKIIPDKNKDIFITTNNIQTERDSVRIFIKHVSTLNFHIIFAPILHFMQK